MCPTPARAALVLAVAVAASLAAAPVAAARPDIDQVVVSRSETGTLAFEVVFAEPVILDPDDAVQIAIDSDRDPGTGVDGLDYSLHQSGPIAFGSEQPMLLTAVDGEPVSSRPSKLRFRYEAADELGLSASSVTFFVPTSLIGDPRRFDFYAFVRIEGELDEAPSHVLFSAGSLPWTYPRDEAFGDRYAPQTYVDGSDVTLMEQPELLIGTVAVAVVVLGGLLAVGGWAVHRIRRNRSPLSEA